MDFLPGLSLFERVLDNSPFADAFDSSGARPRVDNASQLGREIGEALANAANAKNARAVQPRKRKK